MGNDLSREKLTINIAVPVAEEEMGYLIGVKGKNILQLQKDSGAYIKIPPREEQGADDSDGFVYVSCRGAAGSVFKAAKLISHSVNVLDICLEVNVPKEKIGKVIGPKGATLKRLEEVSKAQFHVPWKDEDSTIVKVDGPPADVELAFEMLCSEVFKPKAHLKEPETAAAGGAKETVEADAKKKTTKGQESVDKEDKAKKGDVEKPSANGTAKSEAKDPKKKVERIADVAATVVFPPNVAAMIMKRRASLLSKIQHITQTTFEKETTEEGLKITITGKEKSVDKAKLQLEKLQKPRVEKELYFSGFGLGSQVEFRLYEGDVFSQVGGGQLYVLNLVTDKERGGEDENCEAMSAADGLRSSIEKHLHRLKEGAPADKGSAHTSYVAEVVIGKVFFDRVPSEVASKSYTVEEVLSLVKEDEIGCFFQGAVNSDAVKRYVSQQQLPHAETTFKVFFKNRSTLLLKVNEKDELEPVNGGKELTSVAASASVSCVSLPYDFRLQLRRETAPPTALTPQLTKIYKSITYNPATKFVEWTDNDKVMYVRKVQTQTKSDIPGVVVELLEGDQRSSPGDKQSQRFEFRLRHNDLQKELEARHCKSADLVQHVPAVVNNACSLIADFSPA